MTRLMHITNVANSRPISFLLEKRGSLILHHYNVPGNPKNDPKRSQRMSSELRRKPTS